jgi:hypothetical protein
LRRELTLISHLNGQRHASLEQVGSCLIRPSSKPNAFALSHRAFEDTIGHALIHVLPEGFRLETKPDTHKSIDDLLQSLEPDVELSASFFNTAVKRKPPSLPIKDAADK